GNGRGTGENGQRPGGGANKTDFSPVKRKWNGGERPKAGRVREQNGLLPRGTAVKRGRTAKGREGARAKRTSPPRNGSGTGQYGRRPRGGASEASHETTVASSRSSSPRPPRPARPSPHSAHRSL